MAHLQVACAVDRPKIWKIARNTLIEQLQMAKKEWYSSSGVW
jgi:hypothetical protein